jgi:two-component system, LuxR family, response regulator FixJ
MTTRDTVFLVDDHDGFRSSTQFLLESRDLRVVAYADGRSFLRDYAPPGAGDERHCLLLDVRMPEMSGLQLQEEIRARGLRIPVIFMTAHGDIPLAVAAMRNGALDFLEKPFTEDAVVTAVEAALTLKAKAPEAAAGDPAIRSRVAALTSRERQVFDLVVAGRLNKTIADELGISIKTVELHRSRVMDKMQAKSVAELVQFALRSGDLH